MMTADERSESDGDLLHRITLREPESVARLYDQYGRLALALAYRILDDRGAAEDVVQEVFLKVWRRTYV